MRTGSRVSTADVASQLRVHAMRLARRLRAEREASGHTLSQFAALSTVERYGPISPGDLAARERVQPPSMTRIVAHLERAQLVRRDRHPSDGRQQLLSVTTAGHELLAGDRRRRDAWLAQRLGEFDAHELERLVDALPLLERLSRA